MSNSLYDSHVSIYDTLSQDRDFVQEILALGVDPRSFREDSRSLELFAGPGYHSEALRSLFFLGERWLIDASTQMRSIAVQNHGGDADRYIVGPLPTSLSCLPVGFCADLVFIMRWSLGLIQPEQAKLLMQNITDLLQPGGRCFVELHRVDLLASNLTSLGIRERKKSVDGVDITCVWPSGDLVWNRDDWCVDMPITLLRNGKEFVTTSSREWIYTKRDLYEWLILADVQFREIPPTVDIVFPSSNLVILEKIAK